MVHHGVTSKMIDDTYVFGLLKSTCPVPCRAYCHSGLPNTIQHDIHPNIRLAGNSPAGYSARTIFFPITQKIRHYAFMVKMSHI